MKVGRAEKVKVLRKVERVMIEEELQQKKMGRVVRGRQRKKILAEN